VSGSPYDHEALWLKAKLFLNRAMEEDDDRPFDEQALWASLALELLAKAALARVSPLLVAEPTEDGTNLLIASGLVEGRARFTSVRARTLYSRCQKAFKPFSESDASMITSARNEYLHGSAAGFTSMPPAAWWPKYWTLAVTLVNAMERDLADLVGYDRSHTVERHLDQNKKNIEHRVEMLISRAKQRLSQHQAGTLPAKVAAEWAPGQDFSAGLRYRENHPCPACLSSAGTLEGDDALDVEPHQIQLADDYFETIVYVTAPSEHFSCRSCGLVLDGYQLIEQAGLPSTFSTQGYDDDIPDYEADYGND
jgi:hypothetical protein